MGGRGGAQGASLVVYTLYLAKVPLGVVGARSGGVVTRLGSRRKKKIFRQIAVLRTPPRRKITGIAISLYRERPKP